MPPMKLPEVQQKTMSSTPCAASREAAPSIASLNFRIPLGAHVEEFDQFGDERIPCGKMAAHLLLWIFDTASPGRTGEIKPIFLSIRILAFRRLSGEECG